MTGFEGNLKDVQAICLEMALAFFEFCKENNLTTYLCGGGCIGAVRNGGFIPWDDDLDFFMPRDDYEVFLRKWSEYAPGSNLKLSVSSDKYIDCNSFATLRDVRTTCIKPYQRDLDIVHGIALDIFPIDGCPEGSLARKKQYAWALIHSLFRSQVVPKKHGKLLELGSSALLNLFRNQAIRYRIWSSAEREMSKYPLNECRYVTELCAGPGYMRNRYERQWFDSYIVVPFEGHELPIPVGYDGYLRTAFGDYMKLPPKEARRPHHDAIVLDPSHSYFQYCGQRRD